MVKTFPGRKRTVNWLQSVYVKPLTDTFIVLMNKMKTSHCETVVRFSKLLMKVWMLCITDIQISTYLFSGFWNSMCLPSFQLNKLGPLLLSLSTKWHEQSLEEALGFLSARLSQTLRNQHKNVPLFHHFLCYWHYKHDGRLAVYLQRCAHLLLNDGFLGTRKNVQPSRSLQWLQSAAKHWTMIYK